MKWLHGEIPNTRLKLCMYLLQRLIAVLRESMFMSAPLTTHISTGQFIQKSRCLRLKDYIMLPYCPFLLKIMTLSTTYDHI